MENIKKKFHKETVKSSSANTQVTPVRKGRAPKDIRKISSAKKVQKEKTPKQKNSEGKRGPKRKRKAEEEEEEGSSETETETEPESESEFSVEKGGGGGKERGAEGRPEESSRKVGRNVWSESESEEEESESESGEEEFFFAHSYLKVRPFSFCLPISHEFWNALGRIFGYWGVSKGHNKNSLF